MYYPISPFFSLFIYIMCKIFIICVIFLSHNNNVFRYGIQNEPLAKNSLESKLGTKILLCGLFVDNNLPYLAASADGLVNNDAIVEIKCPASIKDYTPEVAFHEKKIEMYDV